MSKDFVYHNVNPYRIEESDCVCRALKKALNLEYDTVQEMLKMSAAYNHCDTLCVDCYRHLIENVFKLPVRYPEKFEKVIDIAKAYENNKVLIRIEGHLTVSEYGKIFDLWDCTQRLVSCYWIVP